MNASDKIVKRLAGLPLLVSGSRKTVFRTVRALQEQAQKTAVPTGPERLTLPELRHLLELLESRHEEGSYFGPREQYYARTQRLIRWCNEQLVNEEGK